MQRRGRRVLAAVLFTDIVNSTELAGQLGDRRWKALIARHHAIVRRELKRHGGRELDTAGDGFFASFGEPAAAIRCACEVADGVRELGIEIRAGVHFGECEQIGRKLGGLSVVVGARVMSLGGAGDVLVTGTSKDLVGGGGFGFEDRGRHTLKGVVDPWWVYAVASVDGDPRPVRLAEDEAASRRERIVPSRLGPGRRRVVVAVAAVVSVGVAVEAVLLLRDGGEPVVEVAPDSVVRVDPESGAVVESIAVGSDPRAILASDPFVWVARTGSGIVERVDPEARRTDSVSASGHPTALAEDDEDGIWVLSGFDGALDRIHPTELRVELTVPLPSQTGDVAFGEGAVWVTDTLGSTLIRVDPVSGSTSVFELEGSEPMGVAAGGGAVWVTSGSVLLRVDPADGALVDQITLRSPGDDVAVGADAVWVVHPTTDQLTRVDIDGGASMSIDVGNQPQSVAVGAGGAWVADYLSGSLTRLDLDGGSTERIRLGGRPFSVGAGDSGVWTTIV